MADSTGTIIQTVEHYGKQLFRFIRGRVRSNEDAEDILQEVWYQFSALTNTEAIESVSGWLYRVARNRIIDRSRKKSETPLSAIAGDDEEGDWLLGELMTTAPETPEEEMMRAQFGTLYDDYCKRTNRLFPMFFRSR